MPLFTGNYKKGELFQAEGKWWTAEDDGSYQNADDLEDGWDIFLPGNGTYTIARESTEDEINNHLALLEEQENARKQAESAYAASFPVGAYIRRKTATSDRMARILDVDTEKGLIKFTNFGSETGGNWGLASSFEVVNG